MGFLLQLYSEDITPGVMAKAPPLMSLVPRLERLGQQGLEQLQLVAWSLHLMAPVRLLQRG